MKPLVSILIPAYNAQQWIGDTLESALAQSWPAKEIIVVDDGSKDNTLAAAQRFAGRGVSVVTQKNQGAAAARNTALSHSRGDYIQWLDADDLLSRDKITRQMELVEQHRLGPRTLLSSAWGYFMYRPSRATFKPTALWADLSPLEWMLRQMEHNLHMQTSTWLVSRELSEAAGPWNTQLYGDDDGEYFCRVLMASNGTRFTPESKVFYRISGAGSLSYIARSNTKKDAQLHSMRLHIDYVRSLRDDERVRAACVTYLQNWLGEFFPQRPDLVQEVEHLAVSLGGRVTTPRFSWKYAWIAAIGGDMLAKRAQILAREKKRSLLMVWDKTLFRAQNLRPQST
jgi:glycosyltransferase involved in cell wall biosynthesis